MEPENEGSAFSYTQSERLGRRIAYLIQRGFSPMQAAELACMEIGAKDGQPPKRSGDSEAPDR